MADRTPEVLSEKPWQKKRRMAEHLENRGSCYPPFAIEPLPHERQRLAGKGMTDEDRALRRQWLKDQELSPTEPRFVSEIYPQNVFKRVFATPWNGLYSLMKPVLGHRVAMATRFFAPKLLILYGGLLWSFYLLKYHPNDWTRTGGFHIVRFKQAIYSDEEPLPNKQPDDFYDCGFKSRKALLNVKTSFQE